jgi:hypothetical protein
MIKIPSNSIKPVTVKVIKQGLQRNWWMEDHSNDNYYSGLIKDKQNIYSFLSIRDAERCTQFLKKYKQVNGWYPNIENIKPIKRIERCNEIFLEDEPFVLMKDRCLLNGIGLICITYFNYTYFKVNQQNVFNIKMYGTDVLENESVDRDQLVTHLDSLNTV